MLLDFSIKDTAEIHTFTPNLQYYKPYKQTSYIIKLFALQKQQERNILYSKLINNQLTHRIGTKVTSSICSKSSYIFA